MSRVRNRTDGPRDVPLLDTVVAPGEVVEVPDFQPGHTDADPLPIIWPGATWEPVPDDTPLGVPPPAGSKPKATAKTETGA